MKKSIMITLALLLGFSGLRADDWKILEQSEKKIPSWVGTIKDGSIQAQYEAPTLREAENGAVDELQRRIIMAVASNVSFQSLQTASERLENDRVNSSETFDATTRIASAKLPFIKGVSLSEAEASFWQKVENKKSKQVLYRYTVLYPLSESELAYMRQQFLKLDAEKKADLQRLKDGISTVSSVEELTEAEATLTTLSEYFFDPVRLKEAQGLKKQYADLYSRLALDGSSRGPGRYEVELLLDGRPFRCGARPTLESECATRLQARPDEEGSGWTVTYNSEDCLPGEDNTILFTLRIKTARLKLEIPVE